MLAERLDTYLDPTERGKKDAAGAEGAAAEPALQEAA
jgi:hypothetical protein